MASKRTFADDPAMMFKKPRTSEAPSSNAKQNSNNKTVDASNPTTAEEILNKVITLQMKAISLREQNWWNIVDMILKAKGAVLQVTEEDRLLYQVDGHLKEAAGKFETSKQKAKERIDEVENIRKLVKTLRTKFEAVRPN